MNLLFSKKASKQGINVVLKRHVRMRLYHCLYNEDPIYSPDVRDSERILDMLPSKLLSEHGWEKMGYYTDQGFFMVAESIKDFMILGSANYVLDIVELYYDYVLMLRKTMSIPIDYIIELQSNINRIFSKADLPWRMIEGRFIKADSKWIENEVMEKAYELIKAYQFEGALYEFEEARSDLLSGDAKGSILNSAKAFESVLKSILDIPYARPKELIQKIVDLDIIPDYYKGFLRSFTDNILGSVIKMRNKEKGVSHGQGESLNDPPQSLALLALHLTGVLLNYLICRYQEINPPPQLENDHESHENTIIRPSEVPF